MTSAIIECPSCLRIGPMMLFDRETSREVIERFTVAPAPTTIWEVQVYWCPNCHTPILLAFPEGMPVGDRRELVGLPADLLQVEE